MKSLSGWPKVKFQGVCVFWMFRLLYSIYIKQLQYFHNHIAGPLLLETTIPIPRICLPFFMARGRKPAVGPVCCLSKDRDGRIDELDIFYNTFQSTKCRRFIISMIPNHDESEICLQKASFINLIIRKICVIHIYIYFSLYRI